jgi:hypothetical protein
MPTPYPVPIHNVRAYGALPDWQTATDPRTDNLIAFNNAIKAASNEYQTSNEPVKIVAEGWFYLSDTLHIPRGVILEGIGHGSPSHRPGTMLVFPTDKTGIRIHSTIDRDLPPDPALPIAPTGGQLSQIRNLTVYCQDERGKEVFPTTGAVPPNGHLGHGIYVSITCAIRDVTVSNFAEHGIFIASEDGAADTPSPYPGNAAGTHIVNTISEDNGSQGFFFLGANANVSLIEMCVARGNWGYGFRDEGGVGNTYIACYGQGNLGERGAYSQDQDPNGYSQDRHNHDFYVAKGGANSSLFLGCYSEASIDHIYYPACVIGGALAQATFTQDSNVFALNAGIAAISPLVTQYKNDPNSPRIEIGGPPISAGGSEPIPHALSLITRKSGSLVDFLYLVYLATIRGAFHDWWELRSNSIYRPVMRFPTVQSDARYPAPWMPSGLFIGRDDLANTPIHMTAAPSLPATQYDGLPQKYEVGDIIWNSQPSAGAAIAQVCITSGIPDTANPPTFSTFGEVTNVGKSTTYNSDTLLTIKDRTITITQTGTTITLPVHPVDGQTHSIKAQAGVTLTVNSADGTAIDGQASVLLNPGEHSTFRYSAAVSEWERR